MSKWFGKIGFETETTEVTPGVWGPSITEREYYGDLLRLNRRLQTSDKVNDDLTFSNQLSIVADPYATENFAMIRYATFGNSKWKVTSVEVQYPRLVLEFGGVYNDHTLGTE